jgi:DNA (cytosine-5)-methyltransferase 1
MKAAWFSETEAFPSAVLAHHWPDTDNHGDMTKLPAMILRGSIKAPEILIGGTPCQAFSVAGNRESMNDERGQLTLSYVEIANAIDHVRRQRGEQECVTVWENVPGVLSTKDNAFGCFLAALVGESEALEPAGEKWTNSGCVYGPERAAAWRILDAQYFGVAQRRRRVFVVASARNGFDPAAVLFESEGVRRDTAPSREAGKAVAALTANGVGTCGADDNQGQAGHLVPYHTTGAGYWQDGFGTLRAREQDSHENVIAFSCKDDGRDCTNNLSPTMRAMNGERPNGGGQLAVAIGDDIAHTLRGEGFDASEDGTGRGTPIVAAFAENSRAELRLEGGDGQRTGALSTGGGKPGQGVPMIAQSVALRGREGGATAELGDDVAGTLRASQGGGDKPHALIDTAVRRLTPVECERLQGFPDNHTQIPWRKKQPENCPDGPRYKAIGNSKAVPVVRWIGLRLLDALCKDRPRFDC